LAACEGESLAVALMAAGYTALRHTVKLEKPRLFYCGDGTCGECRVHVDGEANVRACVTPVHAGMQVTLPRGGLNLRGCGHEA
jgi:aerobic-type carbon monoxide dehydrogenase small subunit (CoxS/CutS family)